MKKRILVTIFALLLALSMLASCTGTTVTDPTAEPSATEEPGREIVKFEGDYVYKDSVSTLATCWNPHTYQTSDDSYPLDFITAGLYSFIFNDADHVVEGKEAYEGYVIVPEMAASMPVDVTEQIKALDNNKYGIPENATSGYAYTIDLNQAATWQDGTKINAETYVYSMKQLLDPKLAQYRATDYTQGTFTIANGVNYFYQGQTSYADAYGAYKMADLTKGDDGVYRNADGDVMGIGITVGISEWLGGDSIKDYVDYYADACFNLENWDAVLALVNNGAIPLTDENLALFASVVATDDWGETIDDMFNYFVVGTAYEDNYSFDNVGIFASGEYQITLVFGKSLAGFNLLYNLSGNWIVYQPYYDACISQVEGTDAYTSTYNTSVETTMSYGPYKLVSYQADKSMRFERNENWYGYTDGQHVYVDPEDGLTYPMYQTTAIDCQVVEEAETRKLMFLKGELMGYGLQTEDYEQYRSSDYCYVTPSETIFFFIFNGYEEAIENRENNDGFDQTKYDLETLMLKSFRQAVAVTYDKEALCAAVSPARSGGYGLIGNSYIYDPDTGARYRDTDQAKQVLCDFYSIDTSKYASLDDAVAAITGYDPEMAKTLYTQAYIEALAAGYVTDTNNDGICDQEIQIEYASSTHSNFIEKTLNYLNEKMAEVTTGTPFEGKISFVESAPLGNDWSTNIREGLSDTVLGGWSGSALDPFSVITCYTNPENSYDAAWFDPKTEKATITVSGEEITMTLYDWGECLNGETVEVNGKSYCFGDGMAEVSVRLDILAALEGIILQTYDYVPMLQDASMALLSQQIYYVVEEYNPIMGRGGLAYLKYNYNETEWAAYVASQADGQLSY